MKIFDKGQDAFTRGETRASNPYPQFTPNYLDWNNSWDYAKTKWVKVKLAEMATKEYEYKRLCILSGIPYNLPITRSFIKVVTLFRKIKIKYTIVHWTLLTFFYVLSSLFSKTRFGRSMFIKFQQIAFYHKS